MVLADYWLELTYKPLKTSLTAVAYLLIPDAISNAVSNSEAAQSWESDLVVEEI